MFDWEWIATNKTDLTMILLTSVGAYVLLIAYVRLAGLRSFSKMSSFDFAVTVSFGSILGAMVIAETPSLVNGGFALFLLFSLQYIISKSRRTLHPVKHIVDNQPLILMSGAKLIEENLDKARITEEDLKSHLRQAGISHREQVFAVILETSSEVAVIKRGQPTEEWLFSDIVDYKQLSL